MFLYERRVPLDFDFREWLMIGFKNAVGKQADYQIVENATAYYEKSVLTSEDLAKLKIMIEEKNAKPNEIEKSLDENNKGKEVLS